MMDLTKQEKQVIVFLVVAALLGIGILFYKNLSCHPKIGIINAAQMEKEIAENKVVNINTASKEEIMKLKGIGPALAEAIIAYRTAHGAFKDKEEIKSVGGIGPAKYEKIKESIKLE